MLLHLKFEIDALVAQISNLAVLGQNQEMLRYTQNKSWAYMEI